MATQAQIEANRRNAQNSTGPRTPEGKARSSRNSMMHGLTAEEHFLPGEDPAALSALIVDFGAELHPEGAVQDLLVERMAIAQFRLRRFAMLEAGLFQAARQADPAGAPREQGSPGPLAWAFRQACNGGDEFTKLARYEAHLQREFRNCLNELKKLQSIQRSEAAVGILMERLNRSGETNPIAASSSMPSTPAPAAQAPPFHRPGPKIGRNDPCRCGSGRKYKRCCGPAGTPPADSPAREAQAA